MNARPKYYLVSEDALPPVFLKVILASRYLQSGRFTSVHQAAEAAGISRSAYYKYKDSIRPFYDAGAERIVTVSAMLIDKPGVLSGILSHFAQNGANILTAHQNIPINGQAMLTISAQIGNLQTELEQFIADAQRLDGIIRLELIAGEKKTEAL